MTKQTAAIEISDRKTGSKLGYYVAFYFDGQAVSGATEITARATIYASIDEAAAKAAIFTANNPFHSYAAVPA